MIHFYKLNKQKLFYVYTLLSISFVSFNFILLFCSYLQNALPSLRSILLSFLYSGIFIPIIVTVTITIPYFVKQIHWKTIKNVETKLKTVGFVTVQMFTKTKWFFTEEAFYKNDGGLVVFISINTKNTFQFIVTKNSEENSFYVPFNKLKKYSAEDILIEINESQNINLSSTQQRNKAHAGFR